MPHVLLVDDEPLITDTLSYTLERAGFEVTVAASGEEALQRFRERPADVVVLDIMLPDLDGFEVCRRLRAISAVPILMLTARDSEPDRVRGLEVGADDYLSKPFSARELIARLNALLRRVALDRGDRPQEVVQVGAIRLDLTARRAYKGAQPVHLSMREFDLLATLMRRAGTALSREELLRTVWGPNWFGDPRTLDVHIRWLRRKLEDDPSAPRYIHTVRGYGYRFAAPHEVESSP